MTDMHGMEPLDFDYSTADAVVTAFNNAASALEGQAGTRLAHVTTGKEEFQGHFATLFDSNATTAAGDSTELCTALRLVARYAGELKDAAKQEDARRTRAREWQERQDNRNQVKKFIDGIFGGEDAPREQPEPEPRHEATASQQGRQELPQPGSGGGGSGGVSSARPTNLRSYATGALGLDDAIRDTPGQLRGRLADFADRCHWGTLNGESVVVGYEKWLAANGNDESWANVVADAFAAAGGEGAISTVSDSALFAALQAAGVQATRSDLTIDPPTAYGTPPTTGFAVDPVNTVTGNFIEPETDLAFAGACSSLAFTRMYNSVDPRVGLLGPGWSCVLEASLTVDEEGARWRMGDGREVVFPRDGATWGRGVGENYWLEQTSPARDPQLQPWSDAGQLLVVRDNQGAWWAFTAAGRWLGSGTGEGTAVRALRDDDGAIRQLVHERGRWLEMEYAGDRLAVVSASDGRRMEYIYDDAGRLIEVDTGRGKRKYEWNDQGLVGAVIGVSGVREVLNTYDERGRVRTQVTAHGRQVRFAYLPGRVTVVSDADGTRSNTWIADAKGRLVGVTDAHDQRQSMAYDRHGNLVTATGRDGATTLHAYDERGRRIRTVTPEGADLTYGWDDQDRITTVVTASGGMVEYRYAGSGRNPSQILDPLGGRTELSWHEGLVRSVTDPAGVQVLFDYDEHGDLVAVTNAIGQVARIMRDHAGRPIEAISPAGHATTYAYDQGGNLVSRQDADGAIWRFEYDRCGRRTAIIDPLGARTVMAYGPSGELVRTTDPLGRSIERDFDDLGNLAAVHLPDGADWGFVHDALSRLVTITDPGGHRWEREYGPNGELSAVIDPSGVRRAASLDRRHGSAELADACGAQRIEFDQFGRPVKSESVDGSADLVTYDAAGNVVELLDGEGGLTVLRRDLAGRITTITSPTGAITRYEYDECGRPWRTIDPLGAVSELVYDADSRVVERHLPTGEIERFAYDPLGRVISRSSPGAGVARYGYDKAGHLTSCRDTWYGTRRFRYDAAGQLVEAINGLGGRTRYDYDDRGRLVRITDPLGAVTERTYTATDKVDSLTDPLGRITTATYDAAGRQTSQTDPDGHITRWTYDDAGLQETVSYDGHLISHTRRDVRDRRIVVTDHTRAGSGPLEHALEFNRRGQLVRRARGDQELTWEYDADGARSAFIDHRGVRTRFVRDAAGRVRQVENERLGSAVFAYDPAGRLVSSAAGDVAQSWAYRDGYLAEHTTTSAHGVTASRIGRDEGGQIVSITRGETSTRYAYDDAAQLVAASTSGGPGSGAAGSSTWAYDLAGRVVGEQAGAMGCAYSYDAAGQLVAADRGGQRTEYSYDGVGRRVRASGSDGSQTVYGWGPTGYLDRVTSRGTDGAVAADHRLWVDALGELAAIDESATWWDSASATPVLTGVDDLQVVSLPGGLTGVGEDWVRPSWRAARASDASDPWAAIGIDTIDGDPSTGGPMGAVGDGIGGGSGLGLPGGVGLNGSGGLEIAGLEWLGARAYDPAARGFLSVDPLEGVPGAAWAGNPYSYAGNNPLAMVDPTGLRPVTDEELRAYNESNNGVAGAVADWAKDNWEYVAGGAAIVIGAVVTPVCAPLGGALMAAGLDTVIQKATTGEVDWGQVAISGAFGAVGGGVAARFASQIGEGVVSSGYDYFTGPGPHTVGGAAQTMAAGGALNAVTGGIPGGKHTPTGIKPLGEVPSKPTGELIRKPDLLQDARSARDKLGQDMQNLDRYKERPAVFVGAYDETSGAVGAFHSVIDGPHAEEVAKAAMPTAKLTEPMGWRQPRGALAEEWREIPVCADRCQAQFPRSVFPPGTKAQPGGAWGE